MFSLFDEITGKLLLSLHHGKRLKRNIPTRVAENEHFLEPCPKYFLAPDTVIRQLDTALVWGQISLDWGWLSQIEWNLISRILVRFHVRMIILWDYNSNKWNYCWYPNYNNNRKRLLRVFFFDWATLGRGKFDLGANATCPVAVSQSLEKEGILDMARGNVHFQQHA